MYVSYEVMHDLSKTEGKLSQHGLHSLLLYIC